MKHERFTVLLKRPYEAPSLQSFTVNTAQMLAASGNPEVRTTGAKADTDYDALVKGRNNFNFDWE